MNSEPTPPSAPVDDVVMRLRERARWLESRSFAALNGSIEREAADMLEFFFGQMHNPELLRTMETLRADGWCVVLKCMPPELGWIIEGARSEYDAPCEDRRIGHGKWVCEVQDMRPGESIMDWRHSQFAMADTADDAVRMVAEKVEQEQIRRAGCGA